MASRSYGACVLCQKAAVARMMCRVSVIERSIFTTEVGQMGRTDKLWLSLAKQQFHHSLNKLFLLKQFLNLCLSAESSPSVTQASEALFLVSWCFQSCFDFNMVSSLSMWLLNNYYY